MKFKKKHKKSEIKNVFLKTSNLKSWKAQELKEEKEGKKNWGKMKVDRKIRIKKESRILKFGKTKR